MCEVNEDSFTCISEPTESELLLRKKCVPTQTQIREQLGSRLSDVFFENISSEARTLLGIIPPLVGPSTLWIDPNARLRGKVNATPVPEPEVTHLKALTHESILEIGQKYIDLLDNKHRMHMEQALKRQADEFEDESGRQFNDRSSNGFENNELCKKVVATLMEHFEKCFNELVETTHLQMRKECQLRVDKERSEIASYMLVQLQEEVEKRDYELCNDFHEILYGELNILATRYVKQIDNERKIAVELLKETIAKYEKMLNDLKVQMEISTVVDVCRAITSERIECNERIRKIRNQSRENQEQLAKLIKDLKEENCTLQKMSTERLKRLMIWRKKIHVLLQEFQRFINFALKAVPGQSEFLLSLEKLMFKKFPEDTFISPEDYAHFKDCLKDKLSPCDELNETLDELPAINDESSLSESVEGKGEEQNSVSYEDVCCQSFEYQNKTECDLNFDYDQFKAMLVRRFASDVLKPKKKKPKKMVCLWKPRSKGVSVDKSNEWYKMLTLVGENEKEHQNPVNCFLQKRMKAVVKICKDDPEFAKIILGCPHK